MRAPDSRLRELGLQRRSIDALRRPHEGRITASLDWLAAPRRRLLTRPDADYPLPLAECPDPPAVLFLDGDASLLASPCVAIVGSRRATGAGLAMAGELAAALAANGWTVVSGLAAGIDAAAHAGALEAGGNTIAVIGTGPDRFYPHGNRRLAARIAGQGLVVSEFVPGTPPLAANFPRRNRIISGLSCGVVVVEAARRSGSLITARLAAEQGREVFAVPGSVLNPMARGCHALLRDGAKLVESVGDILEELPALVPAVAAAAAAPADGVVALDDEALRLLGLLQGGAAVLDDLVEASGLAVGVLRSRLLALEMEGYVSLEPGGYFALLRRIPS